VACGVRVQVLADVSAVIKVKVKVRTLDIAPLRGTPPQKRSVMR